MRQSRITRLISATDSRTVDNGHRGYSGYRVYQWNIVEKELNSDYWLKFIMLANRCEISLKSC